MLALYLFIFPHLIIYNTLGHSFFNSETYGKEKLTGETMSSLASELQDLGSDKWESYYEYYNAAIGPPYKKTCDSLCKSKLLCNMFNIHNDLHQTCMDKTSNTANYSFVSLTLMLLSVACLFKNLV